MVVDRPFSPHYDVPPFLIQMCNVPSTPLPIGGPRTPQLGSPGLCCVDWAALGHRGGARLGSSTIERLERPSRSGPRTTAWSGRGWGRGERPFRCFLDRVAGRWVGVWGGTIPGLGFGGFMNLTRLTRTRMNGSMKCLCGGLQTAD